MTRRIGFELQRVSVRFEEFAALRELSLSIEPGEAVALVGPSGAGKTTALRLLNQVVAPTDGEVLVDGQNLSELGSRTLRSTRARIGVIPQDLGLIPNLRVSQNVLAGRLGTQGLIASVRPLLFAKRAELDRVLTILDRLGIGEKLFERVDSLSGGEQQRVAIARALYQEAEALIADEPLSALDPERSRETLRLLLKVAREHEMTLVLSMHDIELAREFVPRLVGLREGRILFDRKATELRAEELRELYRLQENENVS